jgi:hypothetical protein
MPIAAQPCSQQTGLRPSKPRRKNQICYEQKRLLEQKRPAAEALVGWQNANIGLLEVR